MPMYMHKGLPADLDHPDEEGEEGVLRGSGTSTGTVTGKACVVKSLAELGRLKKGEILVCNSTDPGWAAAFNIIKGIVTETGGPLAHAACLAREYGMPSVQIKNAVTLIPDGATITVDAVVGRVIFEDDPRTRRRDARGQGAGRGLNTTRRRPADSDAPAGMPVAGGG
ncbi:MAG: PEP-utilizing enzyme, partial [Thermomicrobiales bacterium]